MTQVEGYRYLTRLLRLSLEKHVEFSDSDRPEFFSLSHETAKIGNDNPDNVYLNCTVSGEKSYLISGHRGTVHYLSIESKAGGYGDGGDMAPTGHLELADIEIDEDGKFSGTKFQMSLLNAGVSEEKYLELLGRNIIKDQLTVTISESAKVSEKIILLFIHQSCSTRSNLHLCKTQSLYSTS